MRDRKLQFARQCPIGVPCRIAASADFIVEGRVLLELMQVAVEGGLQADLALNYLRRMEADVCLLINFGRCRLRSGACPAVRREPRRDSLMVATLSHSLIRPRLKYG